MNFFARYARFALFFLVFALVTGGLAWRLPLAEALLIGFDAGALVFIIAMAFKMRDGSPETMRQRAAENEPSHGAMIAIAGAAVAVINIAVGVEVSGGAMDGRKLALTAFTLLMAWLFGNFLFGIHYAHVYYLEHEGEDCGGLEFPDDDDPDYWDFAYFAFVLGMTFQVSDVQVTQKPMRRIALLHGLIAFLFNICVVALTVSLVSDALKG